MMYARTGLVQEEYNVFSQAAILAKRDFLFFYLDIERNQQFTVEIAFQRSCPLPLNIIEVLQHCGRFVRTK